MNASFPTASVTVTAPARLHLGFLDLNGGLGRRFGSIGLAIGGLQTRLTISVAERSERVEIVGPERDRVQRHLDTMQRALGLDAAHRISIDEAIPAHAGLGSGTQLALSVAAALRRLYGLPLDAPGDAARLDRGARSGVGIGLFEHGGLVVDGGHGPMTRTAPIVSRVPFPDQWRVLVVLDRARQGLHGPGEGQAFAALPPMSEQAAAQLCRLALMQGAAGAQRMRSCEFRRRHQPHAAHSRRLFRARCRAATASPARAWAHASSISTAPARMVWGRALGGRPALPSRARRTKPTGWPHLARQDPASEGLDILVSSGLNRGAAITARAAAHAPQ